MNLKEAKTEAIGDGSSRARTAPRVRWRSFGGAATRLGSAWADRRWNELTPRQRPIVWAATMNAAERECERVGLPQWAVRTVHVEAAKRWSELQAGK